MTTAETSHDPDADAGEDPRGLVSEQVATAALSTYHRNPRRGNVERIAESLRRNGQYRTLCVNRGTFTGRPDEVLAGNHTLLAARELGWPTVAVTYVDVNDEQAARIVLVDNRSAELASNDDALLAELLSDLPDLDGTGYTDDELAALRDDLAEDDPLPGAGDTDPDDVPTTAEPHCRIGDVWTLGPHRLVVGDATDTGTWDALLDGEKAHALWTDPPYGVSYQTGMSAAEAKARHRRTDGLTVSNDELTGDALEDFLRGVFGLALGACRPGAVWYVAAPPSPGKFHLPFAHVLHDLDVWRQTLTWVKDVFVMGRADYHYRHEAIFYGWTPGAAHHAPPDRRQDTVHEVARPKRSAEHPTMKPVELIHRHLSNSTDAGDLVVDPFAGSGSTLIACHQLNRRARLAEVDPKYADVICRRYQEHTGTTPTRGGVPHDFTGADDDEITEAAGA